MRSTSIASILVLLGAALLQVPYTRAANAAANADATAGQKVFARCAGCHSTQPGQNEVGPSLAGVFGRESGSAPGFSYSPALKDAHLVWDEPALDKFLTNPSGAVRGVRMFFALPNADQRREVIAYLETLSPPSAPSK